MKKCTYILLLTLVLAGCSEWRTTGLDDIPRSLCIAVESISGIDNYTEENNVLVDTVEDSCSGDSGNISIYPPKEIYMRCDNVEATAIANTGKEFVYWLLPGTTDESKDPDSIYGSVLYGDVKSLGLRTSQSTAKIIGVFANDGTTGGLFNPLDLSCSVYDSKNYIFEFTLDPTDSDLIIYNPHFRIFDDRGVARSDWLKLEDDNNNKVVTIPDEGQSFSTVQEVLKNRGTLSGWRIVVVYKNASSEYFVIK